MEETGVLTKVCWVGYLLRVGLTNPALPWAVSAATAARVIKRRGGRVVTLPARGLDRKRAVAGRAYRKLTGSQQAGPPPQAGGLAISPAS